jgi:predicted permease
MRHQPAFALGLVGVLALGIGVNLAVFGVADRVLLRPPYGVSDPGRVWRLETSFAQPGREAARFTTFSFPDVETIAAAGALEVSAGTVPSVVPDPDGRPVALSYVDGRFFPLLGIRPAAGRFFDAAEGAPGAGVPVAVVSFGYWQRELAGEPPGGGAVVRLAGRAHAVVGVAPRGFTGIDLDPVDVWLPLGVATLGRGVVNGVEIPWYRMDMSRPLRLVGRVAPGASPDAVASRLQAAIDARAGAGGQAGRRIDLRPIVPIGGGPATDAAHRMLARLSGVAALVLIIAVANATHLLLARGLRRQREVATRIALGASRARVWRLLVSESVVIALVAGLAASVAGGWVATALQRLVFPDARWTTSIVDARTMIFTVAVSLLAGLLAGMAPAAQATASGITSAIRAGRATGTRRTRAMRAGLLVAQTALSLVLLVASGLLVASLLRLGAVRLGFEPDGLVSISLPAPLFRSETAPGAIDTRALAERLRAADDGLDVAFASVAPFGATKVVDVMIPGSTYEPPTNRDAPRVNEVGPELFAVMGSRIVWGRGFRAGDDAGEPVTVVNETMARNYWGGTPPSGACVLPMGNPCARVVGVVEDVVEAPGQPPVMRYYLPLDMARQAAPVLVARTAASRVEELVAGARSVLPAGQRATIDVVGDRVDRAMRPWQTAAWLFSSLGAVALVLACAGIYSIVSYGAAERMHELGVRVALGATRRDLVRLVMGGGLRLAAAGSLAGIVAALAGARLLASLLFDVSPFDPRVYAVAVVCLAVAGTAAMLPAVMRASRIDAVIALREE